METKREVEISVKNLSVGFISHGNKMHVIRDITMDIYKGETFAIVGESGSGNKAIFLQRLLPECWKKMALFPPAKFFSRDRI